MAPTNATHYGQKHADCIVMSYAYKILTSVLPRLHHSAIETSLTFSWPMNFTKNEEWQAPFKDTVAFKTNRCDHE